MFYPGDAKQLADVSRAFLTLDSAKARAATGPAGRVWRGGIVPHAGWICSGAIAGETIAAIAASRLSAGLSDPTLVVVFGAVHTPLPLDRAALATHEKWSVPSGESDVPRELTGRLVSGGGDRASLFAIDDRFHEREHAVEVELPLIQSAWPNATLLPVEVPLVDEAVQIGVTTARQIAAAGLDAADVVYLASSDLTHYGPAYEFTPAGVGPEALAWALDNDRKLLDCVSAMSAERIVQEVRGHLNACGGGAIAATLAALRERGIVEARVLRHTNSFDVLNEAGMRQRPDNAVGYAAVVIA
jgi:AmmeMemoRadiSam system protein B